MSLDETALRSLVALLDDEDPRSLELVRSRLFDVGTAAIPYLEAARQDSHPEFAARLEAMTEELRFRELKAEFLTLAAERVPDLETGAFLLSRFVRPDADHGLYRTWLDRVAAAVAEATREDATTTEASRSSRRTCSSLWASPATRRTTTTPTTAA